MGNWQGIDSPKQECEGAISTCPRKAACETTRAMTCKTQDYLLIYFRRQYPAWILHIPNMLSQLIVFQIWIFSKLNFTPQKIKVKSFTYNPYNYCYSATIQLTPDQTGSQVPAAFSKCFSCGQGLKKGLLNTSALARCFSCGQLRNLSDKPNHKEEQKVAWWGSQLDPEPALLRGLPVLSSECQPCHQGGTYCDLWGNNKQIKRCSTSLINL